MYSYWSNVKVTLVQFPSGLISSSPCSNVRLAKHPSFSQTQGSVPWQTQLSSNMSEFWFSHSTFGPQPCPTASSIPRASPCLCLTCVSLRLGCHQTCLALLFCPSPSQKEAWILKGKMSAHTEPFWHSHRAFNSHSPFV